jgi:hemoglobin
MSPAPDSAAPGDVPSLYTWMGGQPALEALMAEFYRTVREDDLLAPLFAHMHPDHPRHVALWFAEVFGGPTTYSAERGGFPVMRRQHVGRAIGPEQRRRWVELMSRAADTVGLPEDAEFRSAFTAYIEWGSRRAMANSQPGAQLSNRTETPVWGWGEAPPGTD